MKKKYTFSKIKMIILKLLSYTHKLNFYTIMALLFSFGSSILNIFGPILLGKATTEVFKNLSTSSDVNFTYIRNILIFLMFLYILSSIFMYFQGYIFGYVAQKISYNLRKQISQKIDKLPLSYFDKQNHGEIISIVTNDVDNISSTLNQSLPQIINSLTTILGIIGIMLFISPVMTVCTLIVVPASIFIMRAIGIRSQQYFKERQDNLATLSGYSEEIYSSYDLIISFNGEQEAVESFKKYNNELYDISWKAQFLSGLMMPITNFVTNLSYVVVAVMGAWLLMSGAISIGNVQAFIQYARSFNMPLSQIAQISNILQSTIASSERVFNFLDSEEESTEYDSALTLNKAKGYQKFSQVRFGYSEDKIIINNFSLNVSPGEHIAIVGPTGAGKTTLVKLMMRFYELNGGNIYVDNKDIVSITRSSLRRLYAMVLQDTWLFNDTIMENIRYGDLNATDEQVIEAAKHAFADDFIRTLPGGYNMVINEESNNISKGQMQLITIARAFISRPDILILDEATSSVDTRTEILIQKAMNNLMEGRTSFIIAHRLSTIKDANTILVLDKGDIVEQGNHNELLSKNGLYSKLYNSQFSED